MKIVKIPLIIISTIILVVIFTPIFGNLYAKFLGPISSGFFGIGHPQYFEGFFMGYALFVSLSVFLFGGKRKLKLSLIFIGLFILLDLWLGFTESFFIDLGLIVFAFLLAQGILLLAHRKTQNK